MTDSQSADAVGWLFIQQYYTKLNADPDRLYQFYNKASSLLHGTEGDALQVSRGQAEIRERVREQQFNDAKVVVSTVDCLASQGDGVLIQVLGEFANNGEFAHKFVQTFFLAAQPGGYFVLNDILRILKDEVGDSVGSASASPLVNHSNQGLPNGSHSQLNGHAETNGSNSNPGPVYQQPSQSPEVLQTSQSFQPPQTESQSQHAPTAPAESQATAAEPAPTVAISVQSDNAQDEVSAQANSSDSAPVKRESAVQDTDSLKPASAPPVNAWSAKPSWANVVRQAPPAPVSQSTAPLTPAPISRAAAAKPKKETKDTKDKVFYSAYIKNVPENIDVQALRNAIEAIGNVSHLQIEPEKSRAFVDFVDQATLDKALAVREIKAGSATVLIGERKRKKTGY